MEGLDKLNAHKLEWMQGALGQRIDELAENIEKLRNSPSLENGVLAESLEKERDKLLQVVEMARKKAEEIGKVN